VHASLALATALRLMPGQADVLVREALDTDGGAPLMRLPAPGWLRRVSLVDVLTAKPGDAELDKVLRGKAVFVGATAAGLHGQVSLPGLVAVPGVEIHALALENLRTGRLMRSGGLATWAGLLETALVLAGLVVLGGRTRALRHVVLAGLGLLVLHGVLAFGLAAGPGWVVPLVPGALGLGLVLVLETGLRMAELKQQRGALRRLFVRYPQAPASGSSGTGPAQEP
jgi:CHASE2 domain-containing sensor protein